MTPEYLAAKAAYDEAKQALDDARIAMQLGCTHERVIEVPYVEETSSNYHVPPYRICCDCGFAEKGWGCGHQILTAEPDQGEAVALTPVHPNHHFTRRTRRDNYERAVRGLPMLP